VNRFQSLAAALFCWFAGSVCAADVDRPNVLLIITDEHNFRTLGCYRDLLPLQQAEMWGPGVVVPTPHLDSLAKEGVICTRAYATAPVCSPCRAAMITGRYPHVTGVPTNNLILDRSIPTLADRLNDAGYRTGFIGKWHLGGTGKPEWAPKVDGGFQFKKFMFNRGHWKKFIIEQGVPAVGAKKNGNPNYDLNGADEKTFSTDWLTDRALDFMTDDTARAKPFFTVISYPDPHGPNTVRAPYDHRFDDLPFEAPRTYQTGVPAPEWMASGGNHPVFRGSDMSKYFGMVQCIDDNIGRLVEQLRQTGQLDNTLIVMTSDHGDLCYEHDRQNKGNPYEGSARVPMILRFPRRIAASQVYKQPVGTVDLTPTVMGLLDLPADPDDQGRDLSATLVDVSSEVVDRSSPPIIFLRNSGTSARWVAAIDARYKLILSISDDPWLFDNEQDPDELLNFYGRPGTKGVAQRLAKALREYGARVKDPYFEHQQIIASLARVLGEPIPDDQVKHVGGKPEAGE
jgi:arylsulfatase A-like enzyme